MEPIKIHPRVCDRHPNLSNDDVLSAWKNAIEIVLRETDEKDFYVVVGSDDNGRLIEIVAAQEDDGTLLIFHAMTPPTKKTLRELGLTRS